MDSDLKADDCSQSKDGMNLQREVGGSRSRGEFLELIFAHLTDAIFVVEPDGRIIDANPAACSMLGHSSDEPPGVRPYGFLTNVFGEDMLELIRSTKRGTTVTVQRAYQRGTGENGIMDLRLARFGCPGGDLLVASCRDLTEQKQLEERLRDLNERRSIEEELSRLNVELSQQAAHLRQVNQSLLDSEQRLRLAIETGRIGLWVWNSTDVSNSGDWSNRLKEIFGLPLDAEVTHDMFLKCVHQEDRERVNQSVMQALEGMNGGEYRAEYRTVHARDGSEHWVTARGQAFFDSDGRAIRFIGTVMDITGRKRAEEASIRLNLELGQRVAERTAALAQINRALELEIEGRKNAEHLARGQLEALAHTLDLLAQESDPDKLPEHVLYTILRQLGAASVTIRERNEESLDPLGIIEEGHFKTRREAGYFAGTLPVSGPAPPLWVEALQTGEHTVIEDINREPTRIILADGRTAIWHQKDLTRPFADLKVYLSAQGVRGLLISPMILAGRLGGIIGIGFTGTRVFGREEIDLTKALAAQAMLAVQLMRLSQQGRRAAVIAERNRLARDIHDALAQGLTAVIVQLEAAKDAQSQNLFHDAAGHVERASDLARESLAEARRSVHALRPLVLAETNLCAALEKLMAKMTMDTNLRGEFKVEGDPQPLPQDWEENLLRIGQEVLTNALRHARASHLKMLMAFDSDAVRLELRDDGCGFDPAGRYDGFGLQSIKERVESMDGQLTVRSAPEHGTEIFVQLPKYPRL
jgi:PAS domain S-box-containing protein